MIAFSMFLIVTGRLVDAEHAGPFARRGAGAAGELGEVVRLVQPIERVLPAALIDEVVPLGNQIVDRAAGRALAERHTAIHAAGTLRAQLRVDRLGEDLEKILRAHERIAVRHRLPFKLFKSCWFTHFRILAFTICAQRRKGAKLARQPIRSNTRLRFNPNTAYISYLLCDLAPWRLRANRSRDDCRWAYVSCGVLPGRVCSRSA